MSGWIGTAEELRTALKELKAERDSDGQFLLLGEPIFFGLDGDVVVSAGTQIVTSGRRSNLAELLVQTEYGSITNVIT